MEEPLNPPPTGPNSPSQPAAPPAAAARRGIISPIRFQSFRSSSFPFASPVEAYTRHQREAHNSLRPPLLRPDSVIPKKAHNANYTSAHAISAADKLGNFRRLVGIDSAEAHTVWGKYNRPAENVGIYMHTVREEVHARAQYKRFSILINCSLGFQIIIAAALTALGAGGGPREAVTTFGAINTIMAAILTFLKGSGLPNREKYYSNEWAKLREYIEQRERDFEREGCLLDVDEEVRKIEAMYNEVKQDVEANTPDAYTSVTQAKKLAAAAASQAQGHEGVTEKGNMSSSSTRNSGMNGNSGGVEGGVHPTALASAIGPNLEAGTYPPFTGLGAGPASGIGLGSGPAGGTTIPPPTAPSTLRPQAASYSNPYPQPQQPHHEGSSLGKSADGANGGNTNTTVGLAGLARNLGSDRASHVLDSVNRLSHKLGADGLVDWLRHLEHSHPHSRDRDGGDGNLPNPARAYVAEGAAGAEVERARSMGREVGFAGERMVRETAGYVGAEVSREGERLVEAEVSREGERLVEAGREAETRADRLVREAEGQARYRASQVRQRVDGARGEASQQVGRARDEAYQQADRMRTEAERVRDEASHQADRMRAEADRVRSEAERTRHGVSAALGR
ncbi:MAG: hypothetical protein LQ340_003612, partial [Diploschistes diacapsis]